MEKGRITEKVRELGEKYLEKYGGCAQATFAAVADGLGLEYGEDTFQSLVGLSGGIGALGTGSCGAAAGAGAAISLSFGIGPKDLEEDEDLRWNVYYGVAEFGNKFKEKYGDFPCREVQMELYGMSFNLLDEETYEKFDEISECERVVADAAEWAAETILDRRRNKQ